MSFEFDSTTGAPASPKRDARTRPWWVTLRRRMWRWVKGWFGGWRDAWKSDKFIRLSNQYEILAERQRIDVPPAIARVLDLLPDRRSMTASEYSDAVTDIVTWADVDVIEEAVIGILPDADIPEQLKARRLLYEKTVLETEFKEYAKTMTDVALASTSAALLARARAELLAITQRIKYVLEQEPPKERARAVLTLANIVTMIATSALILWLHAVGYDRPGWPTESLFLVLFAGLAGGFISVQQRLQEPTDVDPLLKWLDLKSSGFSLLLSPIIGMVFAVVLFAILISGLVTGSPFPLFTCDKLHLGMKCATSNISGFGYASTPASAADWAKLAVWAFAAGFLERLVPDILTRIAATADPKK